MAGSSKVEPARVCFAPPRPAALAPRPAHAGPSSLSACRIEDCQGAGSRGDGRRVRHSASASFRRSSSRSPQSRGARQERHGSPWPGSGPCASSRRPSEVTPAFGGRGESVEQNPGHFPVVLLEPAVRLPWPGARRSRGADTERAGRFALANCGRLPPAPGSSGSWRRSGRSAPCRRSRQPPAAPRPRPAGPADATWRPASTAFPRWTSRRGEC